MNGRYKSDQLGLALIILAVVLQIISSIVSIWRFMPVFRIISIILELLSLACFIFYFYRFFSKNIYKRSYENRIFMKHFTRVTAFFKLQHRKFSERKTHKYIKCPSCKSQLRVKKIAGTHTVRCPRCGQQFSKKI